ncbi:thioredoxin reductase/bacterioferritin-associated ferredoxin [Streptosporangium becharense]|uniref:Thioredoxin reductase/bacterioferritin-associated ferredoxin n=1 Tax=Streptosporangium becharense TaxID=1816182 RepID=A0A7W9MFA8_9ACTN|nr:FAD-dependent oxidoreductase [Streptosporangium becharense]MBB2912058.1 thioredoxin reductase/bacterioferritin-associated ferredoxin [Streptosporangium becharense]MBB5818605.1 thioredoxin reductase/bacterioferritin-associated ferredoxin [Streptosporangium becharense]
MTGRDAGQPALRADVAVVGGGPAGMEAALRCAQAGLAVVVLDEHEELGGQYFRRRHPAIREVHGDHRPEGTVLAAAVRESGARVLTRHAVWGVDGRDLLVHDEEHDRALRVRAAHVVVATGAYERVLPFPGWELPGVVTAGFAMHLATVDRVAVGERVLLAGSGPFLLPVACALLEAGARVAAVVEAGRPYRPAGPGVRGGVEVMRHPARLAELGGYLTRLARHRVPLLQDRLVAEAVGGTRVTRVRTVRTRGGGDREFEVDALAVGFGFRPSTELVRLLGARTTVDARTGDVVTATDDDGATSVPGLYAVGELAGVAGAHAARLRGRLAAMRITAAAVGETPADGRERERLRRRLRRLVAFATLTGRLYPPPVEMVDTLPDEVHVCRCEAVTAGRVRVGARTGLHDVHALRNWSGAGMGICQARECGTALWRLAGASGATPPLPARMPVRPVPAGVVADMEGGRAGDPPGR